MFYVCQFGVPCSGMCSSCIYGPPIKSKFVGLQASMPIWFSLFGYMFFVDVLFVSSLCVARCLESRVGANEAHWTRPGLSDSGPQGPSQKSRLGDSYLEIMRTHRRPPPEYNNVLTIMIMVIMRLIILLLLLLLLPILLLILLLLLILILTHIILIIINKSISIMFHKRTNTHSTAEAVVALCTISILIVLN